MELRSFSGRAKVALVLGYLALVALAMTLGEATGWWSWDDRRVMFAVATPYWLAVLLLDLARGRRTMHDGEAGRDGAGDDSPFVTADEVLHLRFATTRLREGYHQGSVDDFLDRVVRTLRSGTDGGVAPADRLSEADVLAVRFPSSRFAEGYDQDEVDDLLDRVAATLAGAVVPAGTATAHRTGTTAGGAVTALPAVVHEGSRGLRTWTRDRTASPGDGSSAPRRSPSFRGVTEAVAYRLVLPACALVIVMLSLGDLPHALAAARGEGTPGTFVAEVEDCSDRGICSWTGRFVPDDGSPVVDDALLDDDVPQGVGGQVPVLYEGETDPAIVYHAEGDRTWVRVALLLAGGLGYLGFCAWWLTSRLGPHRRPAGA